ncbi:hypothetical protein D3C71_1243180 [compost metagenome]
MELKKVLLEIEVGENTFVHKDFLFAKDWVLDHLRAELGLLGFVRVVREDIITIEVAEHAQDVLVGIADIVKQHDESEKLRNAA